MIFCPSEVFFIKYGCYQRREIPINFAFIGNVNIFRVVQLRKLSLQLYITAHLKRLQWLKKFLSILMGIMNTSSWSKALASITVSVLWMAGNCGQDSHSSLPKLRPSQVKCSFVVLCKLIIIKTYNKNMFHIWILNKAPTELGFSEGGEIKNFLEWYTPVQYDFKLVFDLTNSLV